MEILYKFFFGAWLLLTIFWQFDYFRKKSSFFRKINTFNTLPIWTFFAPNPGMYDTHILYRDKKTDGALTDWQEVSLLEERKFYHFIWNPKKRKTKLAVDAISEIKSIKILGDKDSLDDSLVSQQVKFSKGYLLLMNLVFQYPKISDDSTSRQFIVLDASHLGGKRNLMPFFYSPFHKFE